MTKQELISAVAGECDIPKKAVTDVIDLVFETMTKTLKNGEELSIHGFGKFSISERPAREGINPLTKEKIQIAAKKVVKFKAQGELKEL